MTSAIQAKQIAQTLGLELVGDDITISDYSQLSDIKSHSVVFAKRFAEDIVDLLNNRNDLLAIVTPEYAGKISCAHIISKQPRLDFIRVLDHFFLIKPAEGLIHKSAVIEEGAIIAKNVSIGANCYVSAQCQIGENTRLHANVVLDNKVIIGEHCEIKSGAVIGQSGFGFERDSHGIPVTFPHFGGVIIGDHVYIGANTCIDRGTLGDTIIENNVKIDNLVHVAHNCNIRENAFVIAGTILGGGTQIGEGCWIAPNTTIKEHTIIHNHALIGLGAVVLREVEEGTVMVGNPARKLEKRVTNEQ